MYDRVPLGSVEDDFHWVEIPESKDRMKHFVVGGLGVCVSCHRTGNISVSVACSGKPFEVSPQGLVSLAAILGQVREKLRHDSVPPVDEWVITQWHYGADTKWVVRGRDFEVTFQSWCGSLSRYYTRRSGNVRKESIESPRKTLSEAFDGGDVRSLLKEIIGNQDQLLQGSMTFQQLERATLGVVLANSKTGHENEQLREEIKTLRQAVEKKQNIIEDAQIPLSASGGSQIGAKIRTISYSDLFPIHQD